MALYKRMPNVLLRNNKMSELMEYNICNKRLAALSVHPRYKERRNSRRSSLRPEITHTFGICFDVDGVLVRGSEPIASAATAFRRLTRTPVVFLTNSCGSDAAKARKISAAIGCDVKPEQVIQAQSPLKLFTSLHNKHCLVIGQGDIKAIANDIGFTDICTLEDVAEAYPLLDMVDHDNRSRIASHGFVETGMRAIEAVVLMGEPKRWESALQLVVDVLRTDGLPTCSQDEGSEDEGCAGGYDSSGANYDSSSDNYDSSSSADGITFTARQHIPVFACNADLQFQDRARMPRYGHGAFLCCLEALYHKITGKQLHYQQLIGKPSELSFRYAEHVLSQNSKANHGPNSCLTRMYMIGDTPQADIVGANLYQRHIEREQIRKKEEGNYGFRRGSLPQCRIVPHYSSLSKQTVTLVESILVCTGVYKATPPRSPTTPSDASSSAPTSDNNHQHHHRDFSYTKRRTKLLETPTCVVGDVADAIDYILEKEGVA